MKNQQVLRSQKLKKKVNIVLQPWSSNPYPWDIAKGNYSTIEKTARFPFHCNIFQECKGKYFINYAENVIWIDWLSDKFRIMESKSTNYNKYALKKVQCPKCGLKTCYFRSTCLFNMHIPGPNPIAIPSPLNLIKLTLFVKRFSLTNLCSDYSAASGQKLQ